MSPKLGSLALAILLVLITAGVYLRVVDNGFITYFDDDLYVAGNQHIGSGINTDSLRWAFTSFYANNWHPLTWMSHALDCRLYGLNPAGHHLTSLLIHIANVLLLFFLLCRITGCRARSLFVAALFAVHPLHVESVAWVAERKDVLSTLFWLLTVWMYVRYTAKPHAARYLLAVLAFVLGLMSKPMLVSLPIVLLLLDFWPLERLREGWARLLLEKTPFVVLAAASCVVTLIAQSRTGAVGTLEALSPGARVANALVTYVVYLKKMFWPVDLAVFYPHPFNSLPLWIAAGSAVLLSAITLTAILLHRSRPYILMGWLWYVVTLVPVIGFVQVGKQAMADRYTYVPLIGIFIVLAWGVPDLLIRKGSQYKKMAIGAVAAIIVFALAKVAAADVGYWFDSKTLFIRALEIVPDNSVMHYNLGIIYKNEGQQDEAAYHFGEAARIGPAHTDIYLNLGTALLSKDLAKAAENFQKTLELDPKSSEALIGLGMAMEMQGEPEKAALEYLKAARINPNDGRIYCNLGSVYGKMGKMADAITQFRKATKINPNDFNAHFNLGIVFGSQGKFSEAILEFREAVRIDPKMPIPHVNMAMALFQDGNYAGSWKEIIIAEELGMQPDPEFIKTLSGKMPRPSD